MSRRNKHIKRYSDFARNTSCFVALGVLAFSLAMVYWWLDSGCRTAASRMGTAERELAHLDGELERETMHWNEMKTPERLETALRAHGLEMNLPHPDQVINVTADGHIPQRQMSVVRAMRRNSHALSRTVQGVSPRKKRSSRTARVVR